MCGAERPSIFRQMIERERCRTQEEDSTTQNIKEAYAEMKRKALKRDYGMEHPQVGEEVLVRTEPVSDAIRRFTAKFAPIYEGSYTISKILEHGAYELLGGHGKIRGEFNKKQLSQYREVVEGEEEKARQT
jgi:hypothetical protein